MTFSSFSFISFNFYVCASHSLFCLCLVAVMQSLKEHLKERTPSMPVIAVQAIPNDRQETRNTYALSIKPNYMLTRMSGSSGSRPERGAPNGFWQGSLCCLVCDADKHAQMCDRIAGKYSIICIGIQFLALFELQKQIYYIIVTHLWYEVGSKWQDFVNLEKRF